MNRFIRTLYIVLFLFASAQAQADTWRGFTTVHQPILVAPIAVKDPSGMEMKISALRGDWVLLNLWAAWCAPCVAELPTLDRFARTQPFPNLSVMGVSLDATRDTGKVLAFLKQHQIWTFAAYTDYKQELQMLLNPPGMPITYLVNPSGRIVAQYRGAADWTDPAVVQDLKRLMSSGTVVKISSTRP